MFPAPDRQASTRGSGARSDPKRSVVFAAASLLVGVSLFLPRPMNFSPVGALGLFAGAYAARRRSWLYPLAALTVYVVALGGYSWLVLVSVYLGFAVPAWLGDRWLRGRVSVGRVGAAAVCTSVIFFLLSNLGSWLVFGVPRGETLAFHYARGLPLFGNTLAGDLTFSTLLFGGYRLAATRSTRAEGQPDAVAS